MDQEIKSLLEENIKISKENNVLLLKVRSVQRWGQITRVLYWFIILAATFGSFYFLKPYLGNILNVYTGDASGINSFSDITKSLSDKQQVKELLESLNQK